MRKATALWVGVLVLLGCGQKTSGSSAPAVDMAGADLAKGEPPDLRAGPDLTGFMSECGQPGDEGNELGVGRFCTSQDDCANNTRATLCSHLIRPNSYFCT